MATPIIPFNTRGIYGVESVGTPVVTATDVTFKFQGHPYVNAPYNGALIVRITTAAPDGTTGTLPVYFQTGNNPRVAVTKADGAPLTAADVLTTGYYWFFYDYRTGVLQAFNSVV